MKRLWQGIAVVVLFLFVVSCAPRHAVLKEPMARPSEGKALVNFLRPSSTGAAVTITIWDGEKLIGMPRGKQAFQYECDPGNHLFISWSEFKSPVEAELLPDRVYYIVLRVRMGWWRMRLHQVPINPHHELWSDALNWQKTLPNYEFDRAVLSTIEAEHKDKIREYLQTYETEIKGTKHVLYLRPEDGVPMEE
jgi:predicted class III extradiol MEMO1 family dioxygenase